jgi:hypothetical protein
MCTFCEAILGPTKPHTESDCALKQSAYCPHCGPGLHFRDQCPLAPQSIPASAAVIPSIPARDQPNGFLLPNTNAAYAEYLKLYKQPMHTQLEKNRAAVEAHLAGRKLILQHPIEPGKVLSNTKEVHCGLRHGGNEHCFHKEGVVAVKQIVLPKKKLVRKGK